MALLTVVDIVRTGLDVTTLDTAAAGLADEFPKDGRTFFYVRNGATNVTCTFATPGTVDTLAIADRSVTVEANTSDLIGPFPTGTYNAADNNVDVTYDDVTNVTVKAIRLP
jgi:hypothetical protein